MPDVWTNNPEKLRSMLDKNEVDIACGLPPRVLQGRDKDWTCHLAWNEPGAHWLGDIYIHPVNDVLWSAHSPFWGDLSALLMVGLLTGYLVGKYGSCRKRL